MTKNYFSNIIFPSKVSAKSKESFFFIFHSLAKSKKNLQLFFSHTYGDKIQDKIRQKWEIFYIVVQI